VRDSLLEEATNMTAAAVEPPAGAAPGAPPAEPPKPAEKPPTPAPAAEPPKPAEAKPADAVTDLADGDEPKPGQRIALTSEALRKRNERAVKATLTAEFGTDDPKVLKEQLAKLKTLEAAEEEKRKAQLTKEQQLEEAKTAAEARAVAAEQRAVEVEEQHEVAQADLAIRDSLKDVVKGKYWRHVREDLATHLADQHDPEKLDAMSDADREKIVLDWARQYVIDNPEYAAAKEEPKPAAEAKPATVQKVPLQNGVGNPQGRGANAKPPPVITTGKFQGKTLAPGHPNSMTPAEVSDWKRTTGNNY
jgi:hypothetical protein